MSTALARLDDSVWQTRAIRHYKQTRNRLFGEDSYSNWVNVAGVGTDKRDRGFDVLAQAQRYDPDAACVTHWLPALKALEPECRHTPFLPPDGSLDRLGYPRLVIDVPQGWRA